MDKGKEFERIVAELFGSMGYRTELRKLAYGDSGAKHEIDIYLERGKIKKKTGAVECKFRGNGDKISKSDVANFQMKLEDLHIPEGHLVTNSSFTSYSIDVAEMYGINLVDYKKLSKLLKRTGLEYHLRILEEYEQTPLTKAVVSTINTVNYLRKLGLF